jgi:hypothetical protein
MAGQVRAWNHPHRGGVDPRIEVRPKRTSDPALPDGRVIDERCARFVLSWPSKDLRQ